MCAISSFYSEQVNRGLNYRPQPLCQLLGTLTAAQWISLSLAGNELGIVRNRPKQPNN